MTRSRLVDAAWLAANLDRADIALLDARFALPGQSPTAPELYAAGHIPGARFFDIVRIADPASDLPSMLPQPADFAAHMAALGVGDGATVVVYDDEGIGSAARVWWMLRAMGHDDVLILNGGLKAWTAAGGAVTTDLPAAPATVTFTPRPRPDLVIDRATVSANIDSAARQVIDARVEARFNGSAAEPRPGYRSGHIPGAVNLPYKRLSDPATGLLRAVDGLRAAFVAAGADPDAPAIVSCGSGVTACALAFALAETGNDAVAVYDGSWSEWGRPDGGPVVTGD